MPKCLSSLTGPARADILACMLVIPAIDLRRGKCVRLHMGRPDRETVYADDPLEVALRWQKLGAQLIHVVDLDGAFDGTPTQKEIAKQIARAVSIPIEVGGGIRDVETVEEYLDAGVERVIIGTRALESPVWLRGLCVKHPGRIAAGVDASDGMVAVKGWAEVSGMPALELAAMLRGAGLRAAIYTDTSRDGTLAGPNVEATRKFAEAMDAPVIASGGIGSLDDVRALAKLRIGGMIVGRALYSGAISLPDAISAAS